MGKAKDKEKKNRRKLRSARRYEAKATPQHFVKLTRVKVVIDPDRRWFVVRTIATQEAKATKRLNEVALERAIDLVVYRATEAVAAQRRGRQVLREAYPAAGYLFVGLHAPPEHIREARAALWACSEMEAHIGRDPLFSRILGPFDPAHVQAFADRVNAPPMLELVDKWQGTVAVFPVKVPFPGNYRADLTSVLDAA